MTFSIDFTAETKRHCGGCTLCCKLLPVRSLGKDAGQQKAYARLSYEILFDKQWVKVEVQPEDLPGFKGPRVMCAQCGEGINFKREVVVEGRSVCRACAGEKYYETLA